MWPFKKKEAEEKISDVFDFKLLEGKVRGLNDAIGMLQLRYEDLLMICMGLLVNQENSEVLITKEFLESPALIDMNVRYDVDPETGGLKVWLETNAENLEEDFSIQ